MSQMPDIDRLLEVDGKNVRAMQKVFAGYQGLPELLNEAVVLHQTCSRALEQALRHESHHQPYDLPLDSPITAGVEAKLFRSFLFARLGNLYAAAVADLLRMRLTAPLGYVRLLCESIALLKLMAEDASILQQWVNIQSDQDGKTFFQKYQKQVRHVLSAYNLAEAYNQASGSAVHCRFIGVARGYQSIRQTDGLRSIDRHMMLVQEFDPKKPYYFMQSVFIVLNVQASIFTHLHDLLPEIHDPLLLETRIPQYLDRVTAMTEGARTYFAQYYPNTAKQGH